MDGETKVLLKSFEEKIDKLISAVLGNGSTGLMIRVDRIEQTEKNRKDLDVRLDRLERRASISSKFVWSVGSISAVAIVTAIATIIFS